LAEQFETLAYPIEAMSERDAFDDHLNVSSAYHRLKAEILSRHDVVHCCHGISMYHASAKHKWNTMRNYTLSAGVVMVRFSADFPRYLMLRAFNYWDFPKGVVESGEDPLEAAMREVLEETGLTLELANFRWGKGYQETAPYGMGKIARYYLAESLEGDPYLPNNPSTGKPEHEELRWVTYQEAQPILPPRLRAILNWADWLVQRELDGD
jgi:bis(5'-nucleosidyl)-tetraphosphatase